MKNITLSADENLIEAARARAREERTTLNDLFRRWLTDYTQRRQQADHERVVGRRAEHVGGDVGDLHGRECSRAAACHVR